MVKGEKMLRVSVDTIVYVVCPAKKKTGGTELAHQLVKECNDNGIKAIITYYGIVDNEPTDSAFKKYVTEYISIENVQDLPRNIIIVPEINYDYLYRFSKVQKCIWWMSVDNYVKRSSFVGCWKVNGFFKAIKGLVKHDFPITERKIPTGITHFYQSEYARCYLENKGITDSYHLSDYINEIYLKELPTGGKRNNTVLYNPKKGYKYTKKIIDCAPELHWIAIENMSNDEVRKLLTTSKVYIDFGNHPGKDRFPREAAISGCCVITSKDGSAAYYEDVRISDDYKFDRRNNNIHGIILKIKDCLDSYELERSHFQEYVDMIRSEKELFKKDVVSIFCSTIS